MSDPKRKSCENCELCVLIDHGYSNYTVEGTTVFCVSKRHPEKDGFDRWYGEEEKLFYAEECELFTEGEPIEIDVDRDNINDLSTHQRTLWQIFSNSTGGEHD